MDRGREKANENLDVCDQFLIQAAWKQVIKASHNVVWVRPPIWAGSLTKRRQQLLIWPGNNAPFSSQYLFLISTHKTGDPVGEEAEPRPRVQLHLRQPSEQKRDRKTFLKWK